jgi:hypothetical protein
MTMTKAPVVEDTNEQQIDVADHPMVWRWLTDKAKHDSEGFVCLTRGNVNRFLALWGLPQGRWKGQDREWTHAWNVTEEGLSWVVLSGPQSTSYRLRFVGSKKVHLADPRVASGAVGFLTRLLSHLTT